VLHAYWNLLFKKSKDKAIFSFLYVWAAILLYTPLFVMAVPGAAIPWQGWACILATGSVYCFYFLLLGRSYAHGDLSHSYPIARGLAPVLTLIWALALLGERPSGMGWAGILLVILSIYLFHPPSQGRPVLCTDGHESGKPSLLGGHLHGAMHITLPGHRQGRGIVR